MQLAFTCAFLVVVEVTPQLVLRHDNALSVADQVLKQVISVSFVAVVLTISFPVHRFFGLAERALLYSTALWFLLASLTLPPL